MLGKDITKTQCQVKVTGSLRNIEHLVEPGFKNGDEKAIQGASSKFLVQKD